jgi:transposase InsO family protein
MDRQSARSGLRLGANALLLDTRSSLWQIFVRRVRSIGIRDRPTSARSPRQNAYAERLIGSIRRDCSDHVLVFGERHLRHVLLSYITCH